MRHRGIIVLVVSLGISGSTGAQAAPFELDVRGGVLGLGGAAWKGRPEPSRFTLERSGDTVEVSALVGAALGGGVYVDLRFARMVGIEVDAFYVAESLGGDFERAGEPTNVSVSQPAFHLPLLLKGVLPIGEFSPFAVVGPEFSIPGLSEASADDLGVIATAEPATLITFGAGLEWNPTEHLHLPVSFRASLDPGASGTLEDRITSLPSDAIVVESSVETQVVVTAGIGYHF